MHSQGKGEKRKDKIANREDVMVLQVCDGRADCANGADEEADICMSNTCPEYLFTCDNAQCISQVIKH